VHASQALSLPVGGGARSCLVATAFRAGHLKSFESAPKRSSRRTGVKFPAYSFGMITVSMTWMTKLFIQQQTNWHQKLLLNLTAVLFVAHGTGAPNFCCCASHKCTTRNRQRAA
jgi:hypothetical protein